MTQSLITAFAHERAKAIQRTLILAMGPLATAVNERLQPSFAEPSVLAHAVALATLDAPNAGRTDALRERLARVSRAGGRADLAAAGYRLVRRQELALLVVVDLTDGDACPAEVIADVAALARDGWGLDTQATIIALADDWTARLARESLRALTDAALADGAAVIPLSRVNEEGFQLDDTPAYTELAADIVAALTIAPLRDALVGSGGEPEAGWGGPSLTTVGLARWVWTAEPVADYLAAAWCRRVVAQWLAAAEPEQTAAAAHQAGGWFDAQGLMPQALTALLEPLVAPYEVPAWPMPYPWAAAEALDRLRHLADALTGPAGPAAAVPVLLAECPEWAREREETLRGALSGQLDEEPAAGFALAKSFLKALGKAAGEADDFASLRRDQLQEQSRELRAAAGEVLAESDAILRRWPSAFPVAWLAMLLRPWRWPGLAWEYWRLHGLAQRLVELVTHLAATERELVVAAAAAALYGQFAGVIERTGLHLEEAADMLASASPPAATPPLEPRLLERLDVTDSLERQAVEAAAALGGLGRLARGLDEGFVAALHDLGRRRFHPLLGMSAAVALQQMLATREMAEAWWAALLAEATPLWLYDDAGQPEENRGSGRERTAIAAVDVERLQTWAGAAGRPDWRWLPTDDRRAIFVMRWRSGVHQ